MFRFMLAGAIIAALGGPALAQVQSAAPAGHVAEGETAFVSHGCYQCHGLGAAGGDSTGPALAHTKLSYAAFVYQLRHPRAEMPPYEAAIVSDSMASDIYAYVQSRPVAKPAASNPLIMGMGVR
jgi:mono/diheme cytochrome c family protein